MAQNITLLGASYSDVPAVTLPKTGGGTATFTDVTDTTATASDVIQGKYFYDANGVRTAGTGSGGSGVVVTEETDVGGGIIKHITAVNLSGDTVTASHLEQGYTAHDSSGNVITGTLNPSGNFVTGTFTTGSTTSANETVDVPYTGSGYPIMLVIYVEGGCYNSAISGWYNSMHRYAVGQFCITKSVTTSTPSYGTSGSENYGTVQLMFKNSTSSATSYSSARGATANSYSSSDANGTSATCVRWRSNTRISYRTAGAQYGLLEDTTYRYVVMYSS